jgi:TRAP-type C4-dicarboxylate transport system permease small subunit
MTQMTDTVDTGNRIHRPGVWGRILRAVEVVELALGGILLLVILTLVSMQVVARVAGFSSPVWSGEVARFSLFWIAFGIAGYLMGREEHVTLSVVDHVLPRLGRAFVHAFSLLVVAATCLVFAYEGYDLLSSTGALRTPAAGIPVGWLYILPTAGMLLTAARALLLIFVPATRPQFVDTAADGPPPPPPSLAGAPAAPVAPVPAVSPDRNPE